MKLQILVFVVLAVAGSFGKRRAKVIISTSKRQIIGGTTALDGSFPYQVSLRLESGNHFCGGSIISQWWILTAAHCLHGIGQRLITVVTGTNNLVAAGWKYRSRQHIIHPGFNYNSLKNDVGLIMLNSSISFNYLVRPVVLPTLDFDSSGYPAVVSGWGTLAGDSGGPLVSNGVQIGIVSFGQPCALGLPDVYTRVWSYMDWIKYHIR
ncbi:hypothetical protein TSAR_008885 [Trichomalopsis sarcophagae]|uniref:Peptidase S1 domain-containing protein n=1 Tax=Trichomalopsis sarcophagae TaxID=543379 RepID=A0A232EYP3_9HYME|nr:hypothetical protein TSAR_008885 [Trichomalopsis sarcophagae]